ncbi:hypothetical protein K439DRAFT_1398775, partial [Ramaria rubella]
PPALPIGFYQHGAVSIAIFHLWLNNLVVVNEDWRLFSADEQGRSLGGPPLDQNDRRVLQPGNYATLSPDGDPLAIRLTDENYRPRTLSLDISGTARTNSFRERVRERDQRCCVTGRLVRNLLYVDFRASYIFPIAHRDVWEAQNLSRFIADDAPPEHKGPNSINSVQNGILLRSHVHDLFDSYLFGINPDDEYRITDFREDQEFNGRQLWINENADPRHRPSDDLLREHFRQCVFANVKGAGRQDDDFFDPEDDFDLSDFTRWGREINEGQPTRLELAVRSRLYSRALSV